METFTHIAIDIFKQTLMVSGFVLFMMLIIEYINVRSKGNWSKPLKKSSFFQLIASTILGTVPGCVGTFTAVSLFTHNIINFPALLAASIATVGDEAFVMLTLIPETGFKIMIILLLLAIFVGLIANLLTKNKSFFLQNETHFATHGEDDCVCFNYKLIFNQLINISFERALLIAVLILVTSFQFIGGHEHGGHDAMWETIFFIIGSIISLAIVISVPDHFLKEHLWGHVIKKHFLKIFLWTLGALIIISISIHFWGIEEWVKTNQFSILIIALLVGIIPISGPHILFITLFAQGLIPFSVLLVNSIVQEGHGGLPLLAESKKYFIYNKIIKLLIAIVIGLIGYFMHW